MAELDELPRRIEQAEQRFPEIPFGMVEAAVEAYTRTALPDSSAQMLIARKTADEILELRRQQGATIEVVRTAVVTVQRDIERRTKH